MRTWNLTRHLWITGAVVVCPASLTLAQATVDNASGRPAPTSQTPGEATPSTSSSLPTETETTADAGGRDWRFKLTPYFWLPAQTGSSTLKGTTADVDLDLGDTIDLMKDHFNFGLAVHAELSHERLSLFADTMYLDLEAEREGLVAGQKVNFKQAFFELGAAWTVLENPESRPGTRFCLQPLAGVRVYTIDGELTGSLGFVDVDDNQTWADAMVGLRGRADFSSTFALFARGDIAMGGSDFTWNAQIGIDIHVNEDVSLQIGYRAMDIDYSDGEGTSQFEYDMLLHGPFVALTYEF